MKQNNENGKMIKNKSERERKSKKNIERKKVENRTSGTMMQFKNAAVDEDDDVDGNDWKHRI